MRTILRLVRKDMIRRVHCPSGTVAGILLPLVIASIFSLVFGREDATSLPPIKVVLVDLDEGLLSIILRAMPSQPTTGKGLEIYIADTEREGFDVLKEEDASALLILPEGLTDDLLDGKETTLIVCRNPAQSILPDVAVRGARIVALALSILSTEFGGPIREIRDMIDSDEWQPDSMIASVAVGIYSRVRAAEAYLDSPLITLESISISEYRENHDQDARLSDSPGGGATEKVEEPESSEPAEASAED